MLAALEARDADCSTKFGTICRYELLPGPPLQPPQLTSQLSVDSSGRVWFEGQMGVGLEPFSLKVIAYDCGGKKSQSPAAIQVNFSTSCRPSLKGKSSICIPSSCNKHKLIKLACCFSSTREACLVAAKLANFPFPCDAWWFQLAYLSPLPQPHLTSSA